MITGRPSIGAMLRSTAIGAPCLALVLGFSLLIPNPAGASSLKVAAAGDISCTRKLESPSPPIPWHPTVAGTLWCRGSLVANRIAREKPDRVLALGDMNQYGQPSITQLGNLKRTWSPIFSRVRPTVGNHDYLTATKGPAGSDPYFRFWAKNGLDPKFLGRRRQLWASWRSGPVRFISLNSNCERVACGPVSAQAKWLLSVLRGDRQRGFSGCTVAYFHHPLFSTGSAAGRSMKESDLKELWKILHRFRTDLILNGHQHYYERHARMDHLGQPDPTGPVQIISGTGGYSTWGPKGDLGRLLPSSRYALESTGATVLTFRGRSWSSHFRSVTGRKLDPVSSRCLAKPRAL